MKLLLILLSFIAVLGCKKNKSDDCPHTEYFYGYKINAQVDTLRTQANWLAAFTANGDSLVFNYIMDYTTCPDIADGGTTEILFFEVDRAVTSFDYDAADFQQAMVYFRRVCFCTEKGFVVPKGGTIKGTKLNANSWKIDFDIVIDNNEHVKNSGTFILQ